jgi:putative nucleotidyltransferase with HDIG domain
VLSQADATAQLSAVIHIPALKALSVALMPAELYLVGGSVRDAFYGLSGTDLDLATNLEAPEVRARCHRHGIKTVDTGLQHGTILAVIGETHVEVTTFRVPSERDVHTPAHDIETDLSGRDFTINAIAFDMFSEKIVDPLNAIVDIREGRLRAVGDAARRFGEDPLRILRMARFGPAQGRSLDAEALAAAAQLADRLAGVSPERIRVELQAILMSPHPHAGFQCIKEIGALPFTVPELIPAIGFEQNRFHKHDVFEHTMWVLERSPHDPIMRWAALFHDVGKPHTLSVDDRGDRHFYQHEVVSEKLARERMHSLRFSRDNTATIASIVRHHMRPLDCGASGVRRLMRDLGESLPRWRSFKEADAPPLMPAEEFQAVADGFDALLKAEQERLAGPAYGKLAVTGADLIELGMKPGPAMGALLKELEELVLDDPSINERERLLAEAAKRKPASR